MIDPKEIQNIFRSWESEECPQLFVEYMMKQIIYISRKYSNTEISHQQIEMERILEEILAEADHMEDVCNGFLDILLQNLQDTSVEK